MSDDTWKIFAEYKTEPYWADVCGHGGYLFSCTSLTRVSEEHLDVYLLPSGKEFCFRHGREPSEYYSPGSIRDILRNESHEPYRTVWECLRNLGEVRWIKH